LRKVMRLLTDRIEHLQDISYPSYSERAATLVQIALLGGLAELSTQTSAVDSALASTLEPYD